MTVLGTAALALAGLALFVLGVALGHGAARRQREHAADSDGARALAQALHTAALAAAPLRAGLTPDTARKAARRLRPQLGTPALALTDDTAVLAWDGAADHHRAQLAQRLAQPPRTRAFPLSCDDAGCPVRWGVLVPLAADGDAPGALAVFAAAESGTLLRATEEAARRLSLELELAGLDRARASAHEAEVRALRAQISPHFVYNSLASIASFVRTDPERARELLQEFADFTRYSFRRDGDFTTLAEELRSIEQYLELARARFGRRLKVTLRIAPEVLPVTLPFLCLQPLVENALKHGLEETVERSNVTITAEDEGTEARVVIEDDGVGMEPERLRAILRGTAGPATGIGLSNVDRRLRQVYGDDHGLVIETGVGAGTKITLRVPKFRPGVQAPPP
ncbi:signal transduction histidine kinase [Streptomyces filipinensis]|uniref:histidine kinase n=1 Tax=Streptomyces filipinensis TaxID=66887 RepID=A0A918MDF0_9ACTN|nr:histidine kinase [Streptomyces filipinensis]GGV07403.1 signal transduction histidine kinase [Streptomyces filipinensis]